MSDQVIVLPDCMMPDSADPCEAFQQLQAERDRLQAALAEIEAERDVLREAAERLSGLPWWQVKREQEALSHD